MFEKFFKKLGIFVKKNSGKIIIIWVILAIVFLPFSPMIFQETSYNIAGSFVTQNSMSEKASNLMSSEFNTNGNTSDNSTTVDIILIENASMYDKIAVRNIIDLQNAISNNKTLKNYGVNVTSVFTVEKEILNGSSNNALKILNYTLKLNNETNFTINALYKAGCLSNIYMKNIVVFYNLTKTSYEEIYNNTNSSLSIMFGVPDYYTYTFLFLVNKGLSVQVSEHIAYDQTVSFIEKNLTLLENILIPYLNSFTSYFNYTMSDPSEYLKIEEYSINMALYNSSFSQEFSNNSMVNFWKLLGKYFNVTSYKDPEMIKNFSIDYLSNIYSQNNTLVKILPYGPESFIVSVLNATPPEDLAVNYANAMMNETEKQFIYSFFNSTYFYEIFDKNSTYILNITLNAVSNKFMENETLRNFINNILFMNVYDFVNNSYYNNTIWNSVNETSNALIKTFYGNPLVSVNENTLPSYLFEIYHENNLQEFINETLLNGTFATYPFIPGSYTYHSFVSYKDNVSLIVITLNSTNDAYTLNIIGNISSQYIKNIPNATYLLAGERAIEEQLTNQTNTGLFRALFVGIIVAIIISLLFFRSPIAGLLPLLIFGISADISLGLNALLYKYVLHSSVSFITPTLLLILLLGLTTDYTVYLTARFRREIKNNSPDPVVKTGEWAGHAIFTSGLTVIISYIVLWLSNVPLFSDAGLTNAISISVTLLLALTLLLSILNLLNKKAFWPSKMEYRDITEHAMEKISDLNKKHKYALFSIFVILSILSLYVYAVTPSGMDVFQLVPHQSGLQAVEVMNKTFKGDTVFQNYLIFTLKSPLLKNGTYNSSELSFITDVENYLLSTGNVSFVYGPTYPFGTYVSPLSLNYSNATNSIYIEKINSYIGKDNRTVYITFQLSFLSWSNKATDFVKYLGNSLGNIMKGNVTQWYIGGLSQGLVDANSYTQQTFTTIVPILAIAAFFVLMIQFNSVFTPLRLVLMVLGSVLISLVISYGIFYYYYHMPILIYMPLFVFITLLAVGLDYDIFMITRVREEVMNGKSDDEGITTAMRENGGVIMVLGMILLSTFMSLYLSEIGIIQEVGVGLAFGVFVDTFISWMFFIPSVMLIMKKWNWWPSKIYKK